MPELAELYAGPMPEYPSIYHTMENGWKKDPEELALASMHQQADHLSKLAGPSSNSKQSAPYLRWNYAQFSHATLSIAEGLLRKGIKTGDLIVTLVPNSAEWLLFLSASVFAKYGLCALDINTLNDARRTELVDMIKLLEPAAIVVPDATGAAAVDAALSHLETTRPLKVVLEDIQNKDWLDTLDLAVPCDAETRSKLTDDALTDSPNRTASIVFTSGTSSGKPKGCLRDVLGVTTTTAQLIWSRPGDTSCRRTLHTANFRAIAPACALKAWKDGATVVLPGANFSPETFLDAIEKERVTEAALIPAQLHAVVASPTFASRDLSSVRLVMSGGDIVTSAFVEKSKRHFPGAAFMTAHGMSEGGGIFKWTYWDEKEGILFYSDISPLGRSLHPGARLRLVNGDKVVARGEVGELHISHASLLQKYIGHAADSTDFYTDELGRWFKTGDRAMVNAEGDMYILGRSKDIIKRAGVSIAPAAIESCLQAFTDYQTAVLAVTHSTLGQEPFAILESSGSKSEEDIKKQVEGVCGQDWAIRGAVELRTLGLKRFPLNPSAKIDKLALRGPLDSYLGPAAK
ncbi:4-coumarate--CoA ligase-like 7 [Elsinoe australis]|uniref:4-coumarate--CoA ligase-like 7 n=1 Tax=Elsinoe australis TaxID=40998 RepID=A0A2P7Z1E6_9PEZI|nr:4-coumarate--CoA ligase-like 7 [Elsinoe australis]